MSAAARLAEALVAQTSLEGALEALREYGAALDPAFALYRATGTGFDLLANGPVRTRGPLPHALPARPRAIDSLRGARPGATVLVGLDEAELSELGGLAAHALVAEGRLCGILFTSVEALGRYAAEVRLLGALLAARLRTSRDAVELRRLREERYEHLVRTETLAATGMLSAGVAHELNNPLGIVLGLAELLMLDDEVPERVRADARIIAEETARAVSVVRQLLSYGRGGGLDLEPADLVELVESCTSAFEATVGDTMNVVRDYRVSGALVLCDAFRLQQAFTAVLDNARKAVLSTGDIDGRVSVSVAALGPSRLMVRISDTGPGVDPAILSRIFDPFFSTRDIGSGTGMGLALVHRTLLDHHGEVRCEAPGDARSGAAFVMELDRYRVDGPA